MNLVGQPLKLLCLYLRNFNRRILKRELEEEMPDFPQVRGELNRISHNVLEAFMGLEWSEARKLMPSAKKNPRNKFTFCLIDLYTVPTGRHPHLQ